MEASLFSFIEGKHLIYLRKVHVIARKKENKLYKYFLEQLTYSHTWKQDISNIYGGEGKKMWLLV